MASLSTCHLELAFWDGNLVKLRLTKRASCEVLLNNYSTALAYDVVVRCVVFLVDECFLKYIAQLVDGDMK